jgi:hypothetical protein
MFASCLPFVQKKRKNGAVFDESRTPHRMDVFSQNEKKEGEKQDFS